jgi:hypothetical protein
LGRVYSDLRNCADVIFYAASPTSIIFWTLSTTTTRSSVIRPSTKMLEIAADDEFIDVDWIACND